MSAAPPREEATSSGRRWWPWAVCGAVVVVAAVAVWVLAFSSLVTVRTVEVVGQQQVTREQVVEAAALGDDVPLLRVDTDAVADRVGALDAVAVVTVSRVWPHTLRITVTERRPLGVIRTADGYGVLGTDGVVFRSVPGPLPHLPFLDQVEGDAARDPSAQAALDVVVGLPRELSRRVESVRATAPDRVQLTLRGGATVEWGTADGTGRKAAVLLLLLPRHAQRYDVSAPEAPVTVG